MNNFKYITIAFVLFFISCEVKEKKSTNFYYPEKSLSFFRPYEVTYDEGIHKGVIYEQWIRKPDNLIMVNETLKKIGYKKLLSNIENKYFCGYSLDVSKPSKELIDSLIITYNNESIDSKYYREFWNRRRIEQNDSIVHSILKDISVIIYHQKEPAIRNNYVNDTLYNLIKIKEFEDDLDEKKAKENFEYLKGIGLHNSAYNLLYERYRYYDLKWNQDELVKGLKTDTIRCCPFAFIEDDTK